MSLTFHHLGVPVENIKPGMICHEKAKTWALAPDNNEFHIQYLYFEEDSPQPQALKTQFHICYLTDDMAPYLAQADEIVMQPKTSDGVRWNAMYLKDGLLIELYCDKAP